MTELQHLQSVLLMMASDIDKLCRDNNIEYFLDGGSTLGAIRHKGFIPWDDDFDIIMDDANYKKFITVCKEKLNRNKYYLQEGLVDWSANFSKIRLCGTRFVESVNPIEDPNRQGIFIDVFRMDNAPSNKMAQIIQYTFAKILLAYQLNQYGYQGKTIMKKFVSLISKICNIKIVRNFFYQQVEKYNIKDTEYVGSFFDKTTFRNAIIARKIWGKPKYVQFENILLPVQEYYEEYLTIIFGDYMTPPPIDKQIPIHKTQIDFGIY